MYQETAKETNRLNDLMEKFATSFRRYCDSNTQYISQSPDAVGRKLRPTVIICLGGAGGESGAILKRKLEEFYRNAAYDISRRIQFLLFDTSDYDLLSQEVKGAFSVSEYVNLGGFNPIEVVKAYRKNKMTAEEIDSWWDDERFQLVSNTSYGASRLRHIGRLCLYKNANMVREKIGEAISNANSWIVEQAQKGAVETLQPCNFFILSGSCGGTGSGTFIDMSYLVIEQAIKKGLSDPELNGFITMPSIHIANGNRISAKGGLQRDRSLGDDYEANAYAFLRELQHFQFPISSSSKDALGQSSGRARLFNETILKKGDGAISDKNGGDKPVWDNLYLMDNKLSGGELKSVEDLSRIIAEALFQMMVMPIGIGISGQKLTNMQQEKETLGNSGLPKNFSSIGIAHMVFPAEELALKAASAYTEKLLNRLLRSVEEEDLPAVQKAAKEISANEDSGFNIEKIRGSFWGVDINQYQSTLKVKDKLEEAFKAKGAGENAHARLEQEQRGLTTLVSNAVQKLTLAYNEILNNNIKKATVLLEDKINKLADTRSVEVTIEILKSVRRNIEAAAEKYGVRDNKNPAQERMKTIQMQINTLSKDILSDKLFQRNHFLALFADAEREMKSIFVSEVSECSDSLARQYCLNMLQIVDEAIEKSRALKSSLTVLRNAFGSLKHQRSVMPGNTTYIPDGLIDNSGSYNVDSKVNLMIKNIENDLETYITGIRKAGIKFVDLAYEELDTEKPWIEMLDFTARHILDNEETLQDLMKTDLYETEKKSYEDSVKGQNEFEKEFIQRKQMSLYISAEPLIKFDSTEISLVKTFEFVDLGIPPSMVGNEKALNAKLSVDIGSPVDKRKMSLLRSIHAFPLYTVSGLSSYRASYISSKQNHHLSKDYVRIGELEDIAEDTNNYEDFAVACMTDWLVRERGVKYAENHKRGIVYLEKSYYYFAPLDPLNPKNVTPPEILRETQKGSRMIAMKVYQKRDFELSVNTFMDNLKINHSPSEIKAFFADYDKFIVEKRDEHLKADPALADQYKKEREALGDWMKSF